MYHIYWLHYTCVEFKCSTTHTPFIVNATTTTCKTVGALKLTRTLHSCFTWYQRWAIICFESTIRESDSWFDLSCPFWKWVAIIWKKNKSWWQKLPIMLSFQYWPKPGRVYYTRKECISGYVELGLRPSFCRKTNFLSQSKMIQRSSKVFLMVWISQNDWPSQYSLY